VLIAVGIAITIAGIRLALEAMEAES